MQTKEMPVAHEPARPPRPSHDGEEAFAAAWKKLMAQPVEALYGDETPRLGEILWDYPHPVGQREATVCASLICWLGTNCGLSFLQEARRLAAMIRSPEKAYLSAWAIENFRVRHVNMGYRTLEHCLSPREEAGTFGYVKPIELSAADYETAEHLARWLGSVDGQRFLTYCEAETEARRATRERERLAFGAENHRQSDD